MGINLAGVIFANVGEVNIPELTSKRTIASVPFGGKYRMVDFPLSNMSNCGVDNVAIIVRNHFHSLMDHVGSGIAWDLSKRRSGLSILSPYKGHSFRHRIEAMHHLDGYFEQLQEEYILIATSNCAANIDYKKMFGSSSLQESQGKTYYVPQEYKDLLNNVLTGLFVNC